MSLRVTGAVIRAAVALVHEHPMALARTTAWAALLTTVVLCGHTLVSDAGRSVVRAEESLGITVILAPDAGRLAAFQHDIETLPGVIDAQFEITPRPSSLSDTLGVPRIAPRLYVRTRSSEPESLAAVAEAIESFPQVQAAVWHPATVEQVRLARRSVARVTRAAWAGAVLLALAAFEILGPHLVRVQRYRAAISHALGVAPLVAAAPAAIVGALAGALGGLTGWAMAYGFAVVGDLPIPTSFEVAWATVACAVVLAAGGPLVGITRMLPERVPTRVEAE